MGLFNAYVISTSKDNGMLCDPNEYQCQVFKSQAIRLPPAMAEAFLKWGGPKPMTRFSSPTTRAGCGVARNFKRGGGGIISTFFPEYFFCRTNLKLIKTTRKVVGGSGGMLPRKSFENFSCCYGYFRPSAF